MTEALFIAAAIVAILVGRSLYPLPGLGRTAKLGAARRRTSRMAGSGYLVNGTRRSPVALALTDSTLFYEFSKGQGSIDPESAVAIEYDTALASGVDVPDGRVLRLRTGSETVVEFVLPREDVSSWYRHLPPRPEKTPVSPARLPKPSDGRPSAPIEWLR